MVVAVADAAADTALEAAAAADTAVVAFEPFVVVVSASEDPDCQIVQQTLESVVSLPWLDLGRVPRRRHRLTSIRLRVLVQVLRRVLIQERQLQAEAQIGGTCAEVPRRMRRHRMMTQETMSQRSSAVDHDYWQRDLNKMLLLLIVSLLRCL